MPALPGTVVNSRIVPTDSLDNYATHDAQFGRDGYRSVADIAERDAIYSSRRKEGMLVGVISDGKIYQLVGGTANTNWQELQTGGGTGMVPPYVTTVNGISGAVTIPVADFFLSDAQAMSASLISYTNSVSANLQGQISSIPVADIFRVEVAAISANLQAQIDAISGSDLSNYTLLSTTAALTANLQAQINSISGGSSSISGIGIFGVIDCSLISNLVSITHPTVSVTGTVAMVTLLAPTANDPIIGLAVTNRSITGFDCVLDSIPPISGYRVQYMVGNGAGGSGSGGTSIISGGASVLFGELVTNGVDTEYTISHLSVEPTTSIPVVSVESATNFYRYRIFERASNYFKVALDATPGAADKILWHLGVGSTVAGDFIVTENGDFLIDEFGNNITFA